MPPAIQIDNLGKCYRVNHAEKRLPYRTLRESLTRLATAPVRRWRAGGHAGVVEEFWALRDINFEVQPGEVVGIIGRNGAGKSTLLKILSRITFPTKGEARIHGRVASLLEVGTGFHPELSGRENIYLNGSILGMSRAEIDQKFDEIVEFSGVEKFLDMPVKRYSSGMHVRLAFAVAAHLEPEIVIVDEVLAVGDAEFQKKCLGKMSDVARSGRTVVFVSHNMAAVESLCSSAILLEAGMTVVEGSPAEVISRYLNAGAQGNAEVDLSNHTGRAARYEAIAKKLRIHDESGRSTSSILLGANAHFELVVSPSRPCPQLRVKLRILNDRGLCVVTCFSHQQHPRPFDVTDTATITCTLRNCRLAPGLYHVNLQISDYTELLDVVEQAMSFEVVTSDVYATGRIPRSGAAVYIPEVLWRVSPCAGTCENARSLGSVPRSSTEP